MICPSVPGHSSTLQLSSMIESPWQSFPPFDELVFIVRSSVLIPMPQDFEHSPIFHSSHSQSTVIFQINIVYKISNPKI